MFSIIYSVRLCVCVCVLASPHPRRTKPTRVNEVYKFNTIEMIKLTLRSYCANDTNHTDISHNHIEWQKWSMSTSRAARNTFNFYLKLFG